MGERDPFKPPPGTTCGECNERPATLRWDWAPAHFGGWRCEICVLAAQLKHARERAAVIPALEERLRELGVEPEGAQPGDGEPGDFDWES